MCYCDCDDDPTCKTTELGYTWNKGIKLANGSYALNGTKGDGKHYVCDGNEYINMNNFNQSGFFQFFFLKGMF